MENLNAEQIIENLERSIRLSMDFNSEYPVITYSKLRDALALITSQEQRIKELAEEKSKVFEKGAENLTRLKEAYLKLEAENLKLTEENERLREHNITLEQKLMLLGIDDVYVFKAQVKGE